MKKKSAHKGSYYIDVNLNNLLSFLGILLISLSFLLNNYYYTDKNIKKDTSEKTTQKQAEAKKAKSIEGDKKVNIIKPLPVDINFTAKSYLVYDDSSKEVMGGFNTKKRLPMASLTKIATALVSIDTYSLDTQLVTPKECIGLEGNNIGIKEGERFYVEDLLYGLLLRSASDAACVLYTNYPSGGKDAFIKEMNNKANKLKMKDTNFTNAIGLDNPKHYTTAEDLLKLINEYKKIEKLKIISGTRDYTVKALNTNSVYYILNTNQLLHQIPGTVGYKTGYTERAGECLIYGYNNQGKKVTIIVLGSTNRFFDVKNLLDIYLAKVSSPKEAQ